jgi:cyclopropane-fatty-acyl-phospholipid synthase
MTNASYHHSQNEMSSDTIPLSEESLSSTGNPDFGTSSMTWIQRVAKKRLLSWLQTLEGGTVDFSDPENACCFGQTGADELHASWHVNDQEFYQLLANDGSLGMAESYLRGHWQSDDLTKLLAILCRNMHSIPSPNPALGFVKGLLTRLSIRLRKNTRDTCKRDIATHYDLSNEFFELFLDPTMMYSSGFFEHDHSSLQEASVAKLDRICRKLDLNAHDRVLEIGTGWGGFALHAVSQYGIDLTTTTISDAQYQYAKRRIKLAGMDDRVELLCSDYRDLTGQFDKVVSIEMIEAVGERQLDAYFRQCAKRLKSGGRLVLQAIVMPEQRYQAYRRDIDFIQKYIFPGGFLPSVAAIHESVGRTSNLRLRELEDLSPHYARTLRAWKENFFERLDEVRELGFDKRFIRMWEYYLCYCEAAFQEKAVGVVQIVWDKPEY